MKTNRRVVLSIIILIGLAALSMIVSADSVSMDVADSITGVRGAEGREVVQETPPPASNSTMEKRRGSIPLPQLYLFSELEYGRYDILSNKYEGTNTIVKGYPGVPFPKIDAAYVDTWHYNSTPQLYLFYGSEYARYDIIKNTYEGKNTIAKGYPGVPFSNIDAAYVDTWSYKTPQLYLFRGTEYARYDIMNNHYEGKNTIVKGYPGVPFTNIDAAYVDTWHYNSTPQLYLFSGSEYARYDLMKNTYEGKNTISKGYPGMPFDHVNAVYVDTWTYKGTL